MYKSLEEHLDEAQNRRDSETVAAKRASAAQALVTTRIQERKLEQIEREQLRQERFGQFVVGAVTLGKLLGEGGVKPEVRVFRTRFGMRGKQVLRGWAVEETFYQGHAAGTHYEIDGLARSPNATSYDAVPASIKQLLVTPDQGLVRYHGEPVGLKPLKDGSFHSGAIAIKGLETEQLSGASLAVSSSESPDYYLSWLASNIVRFNVDPGQFGLPTYEPRHSVKE